MKNEKIIKVDEKTHNTIKTCAAIAGVSMKELLSLLMAEIENDVSNVNKDKTGLFNLLYNNML